MTFIASLAVGDSSVRDLASYCEANGASADIRLVRCDNLALAWAADCPWIDAHDDGDVLTLLDGRIHNLASDANGQALALGERYRRRGADLARGLLGDFVIIVIDRAKREALVARDPIGVRPWYHASRGLQHAGAPNMSTLASFPWIDMSVNEHIAIEYLAALEESRGETLYRGIRTLRPGETWRFREGRATTFRHHQWDIEPDLGISWHDAADRCREVLGEAVRCRLRAVDLATSELSGGLDSSTVVGTVARLGRSDLVVGRLLFDTPSADERRYSEAVIQYWGLRSVSARPWIPTGDESEQLARDLRRPVPDANFTMFAGLHRDLLREGRRNGLTGLGGDDAFLAVGVAPRIVTSLQLRQGQELGELLRSAGWQLGRTWRTLIRPTFGYFMPPRRGKGLPPWVSDRAIKRADLRQRHKRRPERITGIAGIDERLVPLNTGYNAAILETRACLNDAIGRRESHPFLDPRFVRATFGLDPSWATRHGHDRALEVAAFSDRLPGVVARRRRKAEFSEVFWPQLLDDSLLDRVRSGPLKGEGWLDDEGFKALVVNGKRGMANAAIPLFRCVALDRWLRDRR